jgi:hypothetical protein
MPPAIHPISSTYVDAQFGYGLTDWLAVSKVSGFELAQPGFNSGLRHSVAEIAEPLRVRFTPILLLVTDEFDHGASVA